MKSFIHCSDSESPWYQSEEQSLLMKNNYNRYHASHTPDRYRQAY